MSNTDNAAQPAHGELVEWKELSSNALDVMKELGDFGPTVHPANVEVKGYGYGSGCGSGDSDGCGSGDSDGYGDGDGDGDGDGYGDGDGSSE